MGQIIFMFATLTIIIACPGLFGLAAYMGEQRGKEISIRKVLGASVNLVIFLLLKDFTLLVGIAFVIAAPIGWYVMARSLKVLPTVPILAFLSFFPPVSYLY